MSKKYSEIYDLSFYDYPKTIAKYKIKKRNGYKHTIDRFKQLYQKRDWIMSVVVENKIKG